MIMYDPSPTNEPSLSSSFTNEDFLAYFSVQLTNRVVHEYICNTNRILESCLLMNALINLCTLLAYSSIWRWDCILITPKFNVAFPKCQLTTVYLYSKHQQTQQNLYEYEIHR